MQTLQGSPFFSKCLKFDGDCRSWAKSWENVFYITALRLVSTNSHYYEEKTCRQ